MEEWMKEMESLDQGKNNTEVPRSGAAVKWNPCVWKQILQPDCHAEELWSKKNPSEQTKTPFLEGTEVYAYSAMLGP